VGSGQLSVASCLLVMMTFSVVSRDFVDRLFPLARKYDPRSDTKQP
jgi:hypothetical protein